MRSITRRRRRPTGFTLIEVLVVVAIIALLVSILLPSLRRARDHAKAVMCQSSLKQISLALLGYQLDSKGYVPNNLWSENTWGVGKAGLWFYKLDKYLPDPKIYICAADPFGDKFDYEAIGSGGVRRTNTRVPSCGYGMNYLLRHWHEAELKSFKIEYYRPTRPGNTILLAEVGPDDRLQDNPFYSGGMGQPWRDGGRIIWDDGARPWDTPKPTWLTARHFGGINMLSMDFAVHRVRTREVLRLSVTPRIGIQSRYEDCERGGCYFCNYERIDHYNFAPDKMWWWTGPMPDYP